MNRGVYLLVGTAFALAACEPEAPADDSPVAPSVVCDEINQSDGDSALECSESVGAVEDRDIGDDHNPETMTP